MKTGGHGVSLAAVCDSRDNNFNLLRFGAALAVFVSHCPPLAGLPVISITTLLGYVAVNAFFAISGFLVAKSLYSRRHLGHFLVSRGLRIYPALVVAVFYTLLVAGAWLSDLQAMDFLGQPLTRAYLHKNSLQLFWPIPTTLPGMDGEDVNGPLWTLPFELHMYLLLALAGSLAVWLGSRYGRWIWGLYFIAVAVSLGLYAADYAWGLDGYGLGHKRYYLRFLAMFGIGVAMFMLRERICLSHRVFLAILALVAVSSTYRPLFVLLAYGALAYVLLYLAYIPGGPLRLFNRLGDYSYGIYIFGYPTQKAVMTLFPAFNVVELFLVAFALTLGMAVASWHWIERPALRLKQRFAATGERAGRRGLS